MYADFKLKFNLQCLLFEHSRYVYSSVPIQPLRSHRLDPARPMSMHGPLHGCSARPNLEAVFIRPPLHILLFFFFHPLLALCTVATLLSTVAGSSMGPGRGFQPRLTSAPRARDHDLTSLPNLMQLFTHATLRALLSFLSLSH